MSEQRHIIKRQIIELQVQDQAKAKPLQAEAGRVYRQRVVPLLDKYCTELSEPDHIHRIESLAVDLGTIDPQHFEAELVAKLSTTMRESLTKQISEQERGAGRRDQSLTTTSQLELLDFFARTGSLPWWADVLQPRLLNDILQSLIRDAPAPLSCLMRDLAREPRPLKRLVVHYDEEVLLELCRLLAPYLKASLDQFPRELTTLLQKSRPVTGRTQVQFRHIVWLGILRTAGLDGWQHREPSAFWREVLLQIALTLGVTYASVVSGIHRRIQVKTTGLSTQLRHIAEILFQDLQCEDTGTKELVRILEQLQRSGGPIAALSASLRPIVNHLTEALRTELLAVLKPPVDQESEREITKGVMQTLERAIEQGVLPLTVVGQLLAENMGAEEIIKILEHLQCSGGSLATLSAALRSIASRLPEALRKELLAVLKQPGDQESEREITKGVMQTLERAIEQGVLPSTVVGQLLAENMGTEEIIKILERLQYSEGSLAILSAALRPIASQLPDVLRTELMAAIKQPGDHESDRKITKGIMQTLGRAIKQGVLPSMVVVQLLVDLQKRQVYSPPTDVLAQLTETLQQAIQKDMIPEAKVDEMLVDLSFSESDDLYVDNSGLVILWPFLERFFERLDLLEERRFKDIAAVQRAIGLLQVLVTEMPALPEYLLPLNKVLCGMELTEVFEFDLPVTATEAKECAGLLAAVIERAPILRNMSLPGFRGTFLLRKGVLGTRDGAWLLRVERETYDVVLDSFPWGWEWVKLPWMEAPLRVEW
ncbi:contractile injection system tape measure protein [Planctomycetota bacterium]